MHGLCSGAGATAGDCADAESFVEAGSMAESLGIEVGTVVADLENAKLTLGC